MDIYEQNRGIAELSSARANTQTINVVVYGPKYKTLWDSFVSTSKNGVFLFYRDYMEYHSDRFFDHSLLFFKNGKLIGILPANVSNDTLYSHEGLTFGGVISGYSMKTPDMMEIFEQLIEHCKKQGLRKVVYKAIPHIYHTIPAEEDLYALFYHNARLISRNVSSSILVHQNVKYSQERRRGIKKAKSNGLIVKRSFDFDSFMKIEEEVLLKRHGVKPVHGVEEITLLANRFPDNIKLFAAFKDNLMLAGSIVFESTNVAHAQYAANPDGSLGLGALDLVFDYLITDYYRNKRYFDFGISTERFGQDLNYGLVHFKEGFGARAVMHDFYQLST